MYQFDFFTNFQFQTYLMSFEKDIEEYFSLQNSIQKLDDNIKEADKRIKELTNNIRKDEKNGRTSATLTEIQNSKNIITKNTKARSEQVEKYFALKRAITGQLRSYPDMDFKVTPSKGGQPYTIKYKDGEIKRNPLN